MESIIHRRRELAVRVGEFVFGRDNLDSCKVIWAFIFFLPVLAVKTLRFVFWDSWIGLLKISKGLFGFALGFTAASLLAGLSFGLYLYDPGVLAGFWQVAGIMIGMLLFMVLCLGGSSIFYEYSETPEGRKTLDNLSQTIEIRIHRFADSLPGKILYWALKPVWFLPVLLIKLVFYHFLWKFVCQENEDNLAALTALVLVVMAIGLVVTGLVMLFLYSIFIGVLLLSSIAGLIIVGIPVVLGVRAFFESGTKDALVESFWDFKHRHCRPYKIID